MAGITNPIRCKAGAVNSDFNNYTTPGVYSIVDQSISNDNNPGVNYGVLLVYESQNGYVIQLATDTEGYSWMRFINKIQHFFGGWRSIS